MTDEDALATGLARLVDKADLLPRLASEITARPLRAWSDYAADAVLG